MAKRQRSRVPETKIYPDGSWGDGIVRQSPPIHVVMRLDGNGSARTVVTPIDPRMLAVFERDCERRARAAQNPNERGRIELADIRQRMQTIVDCYRAGLITRAEFVAARRRGLHRGDRAFVGRQLVRVGASVPRAVDDALRALDDIDNLEGQLANGNCSVDEALWFALRIGKHANRAVICLSCANLVRTELRRRVSQETSWNARMTEAEWRLVSQERDARVRHSRQTAKSISLEIAAELAKGVFPGIGYSVTVRPETIRTKPSPQRAATVGSPGSRSEQRR